MKRFITLFGEKDVLTQFINPLYVTLVTICFFNWNPYGVSGRKQHNITTYMGLHAVPQPRPHLGILFGPNCTCRVWFVFLNILELLLGNEKGFDYSRPRKILLWARKFGGSDWLAVKEFRNGDDEILERGVTDLSFSATIRLVKRSTGLNNNLELSGNLMDSTTQKGKIGDKIMTGNWVTELTGKGSTLVRKSSTNNGEEQRVYTWQRGAGENSNELIDHCSDTMLILGIGDSKHEFPKVY